MKDEPEHPDVAEISDLTEGLLPPARATVVRRHLDACGLCADVRASLEEIRGMLGTVPGPPPMPAEIASRIDAALAAEALLSTTAPPAGEAFAPPSGAPPEAPTGGPANVSRETSMSSDRPAGHPRSSTIGPGRKGRLRGGRRRAAVLGAVFTVAALGLGSVSLSSWNDSAGTKEERRTTAADTFSEGKLEEQVTGLLARSRQEEDGSRTPSALGMQSESGAARPRVLKQPVVPECVREGIGRNDAALAAEQGRYRGQEALLVVLPDASDDARVTAYIVEATCVDHPSPDTTAKVLLQRSYTRS